jgi:hypothetical protein
MKRKPILQAKDESYLNTGAISKMLLILGDVWDEVLNHVAKCSLGLRRSFSMEDQKPIRVDKNCRISTKATTVLRASDIGLDDH